jgi:hypothetical protein
MLEPHGSVILYVEVPNGISVFGNSQMWDIIYPHVSYFTPDSLRSLFERSGFEIMEIGTSFSNQFLYAEVRLASASSRIQPARIDSPVRDLIASFNTRFTHTVSAWSNLFKYAIRTNKRVTFWGAGAKGVTFLNVVPYASELSSVIDSNPRKQGMFVPGTGQRILSPEEINAFQPEIVVTLNPIYQPEIEATLRELGVDAEIVSHANVARSASY